MIYSHIIRPLLFALDAERAHRLTLNVGKACRLSPIKSAINFATSIDSPRLSSRVFGIEFKNPIGLAAGCDKDAECLELFSALGFGHIEIGTVTAKPQPGNARPRIFKFAQDRALINRMGFPSQGAPVVQGHILRAKERGPLPILGINIGKSREVSIDDAVQDYLISFKLLAHYVDYVVVNVSSPNTPELRKLQEPERLSRLLSTLQDANTSNKPLLVKIAPDLSEAELHEVINVCLSAKVSGVIAVNTTFARDGLSRETAEQGGLSGAPLHARAKEVLRFLYQNTGGKLPIVGVGGVFSGEDAFQMFRLGAQLVQLYTGLVFEGPMAVKRIKKDILRILDGRGILSISDVVGKGAK